MLLCLSDPILQEYLEVLARFGEVRDEALELAELLTGPLDVLFVEPDEPLSEVSRDPDDNRFLECALAAQADVLISGDHHLLSLGSFRGIPILSPAQFLACTESL